MSNDSKADATDEKVTFDAIPLSDEVKAAVAELGYTHPTPVQRAVFEFAARGKDLVVQARTGTGKTAAFGLPLVDRLVRARVKAVQALVLCPTRELALQVTRELSALSKNNGLNILPVYGGAPMIKQIEGLKNGAQILVGTPGRVLDHLRRGTFDASKVRAFTLDECDEMLSMGFLPQINEIWDQLPQQLQILLFSATVPKPVLRVAESRLRDPEFITLSGDQVGALEIEHYVYISQGDKVRDLLRILKAESPDSAIIFCNTRDDTQRVALALQKEGYSAAWLNADLSQNEREAVMTATRERRLPFLVCTDVAARGIDISHLTHVINFDFPESNEQYVHRTGRTGRAGKTGTAISLVSPGSIGNLYYLRLEYKIHPLERQLPSDQELQTRAETEIVRDLVGAFTSATSSDRSLVRRLLTHDSAEMVLAGLLRSHLKATEETQTPSEGDPSSQPVRSPRASRSQAPRNRTRAPRKVESEAADSPADALEADKPAASTSSQQPAVACSDKQEMPAETPSEPSKSPEPRPRRSDNRPDNRRTVSGDRSELASGSRPRRAPRSESSDASSGRSNSDRGNGTKPRSSRRSQEVRTVTEDGFSYEVRPAPGNSNAPPSAEQSSESTSERPGRASSGETPSDGNSSDNNSSDSNSSERTSAERSRSRSVSRREPERRELEEDWEGPIDEIFVNVGRDDRVKTAELRSALETADVAQDDIAYVRVRQRHTFIGVRQGVLEQVIEGLSGQTIAGRTVAAEQARPRQPRS